MRKIAGESTRKHQRNAECTLLCLNTSNIRINTDGIRSVERDDIATIRSSRMASALSITKCSKIVQAVHCFSQCFYNAIQASAITATNKWAQEHPMKQKHRKHTAPVSSLKKKTKTRTLSKYKFSASPSLAASVIIFGRFTGVPRSCVQVKCSATSALSTRLLGNLTTSNKSLKQRYLNVTCKPIVKKKKRFDDIQSCDFRCIIWTCKAESLRQFHSWMHLITEGAVFLLRSFTQIERMNCGVGSSLSQMPYQEIIVKLLMPNCSSVL